MFIKRAIKPGE